ncbi:uncharacterized protein LOC141648918 [Silene latifolia]|uniref:uncharacterized protein LOC141648918 n=1 Tax=Silene latifolia TaxID=37657 RepID=UPI003D76C7AB
MHKVRHLLLPFEHDNVFNIRLSSLNGEDKWCWALEKDGEYSVTSAYHTLMDGEVEEQGSSSFEMEKRLWKRMWTTKTIPRVKMFFWQLCSDAIPTKDNIARRARIGDGMCPICCSEMESCLHLVKGCGWVGGVWDGLGVKIKKEAGNDRVREWVEDMWREMEEEERGRFMMGCWAIWEARNKWVFEGRRVMVMDVIKRVEELTRKVEALEGEGAVCNLSGDGKSGRAGRRERAGV